MEQMQIDFGGMMAQMEEKKAKAKELRCEAEAELEALNDQHAEALAEYEHGRSELQGAIDAFEAEWEPRLKEYRKEAAGIKRRYNKRVKEL